ncbi:MAG: argininosuccinate synthase [Cytophagaceae bacterium]|jgi:argininosuccinate synthase|nr:argininosuccinate synthase [Cytophagaceae bacterium]
MKKKVVLAFSGGLDTTYCVKYLAEDRGFEVHTVIVDTGGFTKEELADIEKKAYELGVTKHLCVDQVPYYYEHCIRYMIFGNVLKNNTYPLSVSAERMFQALAIANYAKEVKADAVAHGSTGAGNDQVRFDVVFHILIPGVDIITPIRDNKLSREAEIEYLKAKGVVRDWTKAAYSINKGIWGTSVGGKETLSSDGYLPEAAWPTQVSKSNPEEVTIDFVKGEPAGLNGKKMSAVDTILALREIAQPFGIGRDIHVGDTIIGIKGRVGFEAAAPLILIKAHHLLEKHTLTKWQLYWKEQLGNWYGSLLHEGQYLEPVMRNIEKFLEDTQASVTGTVRVRLSPYNFNLLGITSPFDMMSSKFGTYGEMNNTWSGNDVRGFSKILANQAMFHGLVNNETK